MAFILRSSREPQWTSLIAGVSVLLRPLDFYSWRLLNVRANRAAAELTRAAEALDDMGAEAAGMSADEIQARRDALSVEAIAKATIVDWRGVVDEAGKQAPVTPENITALMAHPLMASRLESAALSPIMEILAEGEDSGAARNGSSAPAPSTAGSATTTAPHAPEAVEA